MKRFIKISVIILIILAALFTMMFIPGSTITNPYNKKATGASIIPEESAFFDFYPIGEKTYYKCRVTLKNETSENK